MIVAILAGGLGTRLAEETEIRPKPMVEIGGKPILWHIMKIYAHYGFKDFVIALGYKGEHIKKYMVDCTVKLIDTGMKTQTGGRIKRLAPYVDGQTFMLTWGDGVADIDLTKLLEFHRSHGKLATLTAVRPPARYGHLELDGDSITEFSEKPQTREGWINGAFFVLEPGVFDYIAGDDTQWEKEPLENLARDGQLKAYRHTSYWQCMDTLREKYILENVWNSGNAPWQVWKELK
jgi:glucose-1-phosphate cytidylyltransferase